MSKTTSLTKQTLHLFWHYNMRYKAYFFTGLVGAILSVISQSIIPPFIVARTFAKLQFAFIHHQTLNFQQFLPYLLIYGAAMIIGMLFWRLQSFFVWKLEAHIHQDMANDIFNNLQKQSHNFHADRFSGALVSQATKLLGSYERLTDDLIWNITPGLTTLLFSIIVLIFISPWYALILSLISILYMINMSFRIKKQLPFNIEEALTESTQTAALADALANVSTIRSFANEQYEAKRFGKISSNVYKSQSKLSFEIFKTEALSHFQTNMFQVIALFTGLAAVTTFGANISTLYLLLSYTQAITNQLWQFSRIVRNVNRSLGDSAEMTQILNSTPEIIDPNQPIQSTVSRGEINFNHVTFSYKENKDNLLFNDLNFKIKPGEKVGLVGPSGGGKSTITKLLLRFNNIDSGSILVDNNDIALMTQHDLRKAIAYVSQEPILFHRSLESNIRYGNLSASKEEIETVAKLAHASEFIEALPLGYQTLVGERGIKLSGGQRQRIAIARAMLKNAPILVLDEATSALDSESEVLIQDALWTLMKDKTAIIIAHRLSTIQKMDRIIVLSDGQIIEQGSHKELLKKGGLYSQLWNHQSGGFIED